MDAAPEKQHQRISKRYVTPGLIDFVSPDESEYHYGFLVNLSKQGLYVESDRVFEVGSVHTLRFVLPVLDWVFEAQARAVWTHVREKEDQVSEMDSGMGFYFEKMDAKDLEQLDVFFDMHARGQTEITEFSSS